MGTFRFILRRFIRPHLNLSNIRLWIYLKVFFSKKSKFLTKFQSKSKPQCDYDYFLEHWYSHSTTDCIIIFLVRSIKLNLFISPVLGVDFCPFPSGYKYDICFNNIQSKLASSHSYCRIQLIQTIYLPLPPQQIQSVYLQTIQYYINITTSPLQIVGLPVKKR